MTHLSHNLAKKTHIMRMRVLVVGQDKLVRKSLVQNLAEKWKHLEKNTVNGIDINVFKMKKMKNHTELKLIKNRKSPKKQHKIIVTIWTLNDIQLETTPHFLFQTNPLILTVFDMSQGTDSLSGILKKYKASC